MCNKFSVCGKKHLPRWKTSKKLRNSKGQFDKDRRFYKYLIIGMAMYGLSMIGVNTIWGWMKGLEQSFMVENSKAEEIIKITWQDQVKKMISEAGLDVVLATRIIQHESWWQPDNTHINKDGTRDRGLWMLSEKWHPEVSDECSYDWFCSTVQAIRIWKERGPQEWIAYKYVK